MGRFLSSVFLSKGPAVACSGLRPHRARPATLKPELKTRPARSAPPRITNHAPAGDIAGTVSSIDVWFSEKIDKTTFTAADVAIVKPDGQTVAATGIQEVGLNRFRAAFQRQTAAGSLPRKIGPNIADLAGNVLDQDRDGNQGEPSEDVYDAWFNLVQVDLGLTNLTVSTQSSGLANR